MNKQNIIGAIAVIALILGGVALSRGGSSNAPLSFGAISNTNAPAANTVLVDGVLLPNPSVYDYLVARTNLYTDESLAFGTESGAPILQQGSRQLLASGTTTPCSIANPFSATSTVLSFSYNLTTGTSTPANGVNLIVGTSTTAFATTTTMINSVYIAASALSGVTWDPGTNNGIIGPGQFIVVGYLASSTLTTGGIITAGTCQAMFQTAY